jgi:hypothetical protein
MIVPAARRSRRFITYVAIATVLGSLISGALLISADRYVALAAVVQAAAVIPSITIAALALTRDSRDKRVDRVLDLHRELHAADLESAKARLTVHLKKHGVDGKTRPTSREELATDPLLSRYEPDNGYSPRPDVDMILRFFERADLARVADSVEVPLMVELVGRNATWWNLAITGRTNEVPRSHLKDLAAWADKFVDDHGHQYPFFENWGRNRMREFGRLSPEPR